MATAAQIKKIHTVKRILHLSDEDYRSNLNVYGVESSADPRFTFEMADDFIQKLSLVQSRINPHEAADKPSSAASTSYTGKGKRGFNKHITPARAQRITILEKILGWDATRIRGFITKQTGFVKGVEMLTSMEGGKVITGLTRIYANGNRDLYLAVNKLSNSQLRKLIKEK